jgi:hypothetical protein
MKNTKVCIGNVTAVPCEANFFGMRYLTSVPGLRPELFVEPVLVEDNESTTHLVLDACRADNNVGFLRNTRSIT